MSWSMDRVPDSELMPLCAAAAIAWGSVVDYPTLKLDSVELDEQLRHMEALLRLLMPVYGDYPLKIRKSDLYRALKALPSGLLQGEWWTVKQQNKPRAARAVEVRFPLAAGQRRAA